MEIINSKINTIDKYKLADDLNQKGYAIVNCFLSHTECNNLKELYTNPALYRKTVVMERHRFGFGEYKYFDYPLPDILQSIRQNLYPELSKTANLWMKALNTNTSFPLQLKELHEQCRINNQVKPTVLILKYGQGGYNTLHQDLYGDVYFPLQAVLFLSDPDNDYTGGEFVLTEQVPRAQSKVIVLKPKKGDMLIFTTNFKPVKGIKGYYRINMKHGVSEVTSGERYALGIIFHDAIS